MITLIRKHLVDNLCLKILSLSIGYGIWHILSLSSEITIAATVPLCYYNIPEHSILKGPTHITAALHGKRSVMRTIDYSSLAVHIDAHTFHPGKHAVYVDAQKLFLPRSIKLVSYSPSNIIIESYYNHNLIQTE
jgi:hypothetical protein